MSNFNGFTDFEIRQRDTIRELIEAGGLDNCNKARELRRKFLRHKTRRNLRSGLLRTVKFMVSVTNGLNTQEGE